MEFVDQRSEQAFRGLRGHSPLSHLYSLTEGTVTFHNRHNHIIVIQRCFVYQKRCSLPSLDQIITWHGVTRIPMFGRRSATVTPRLRSSSLRDLPSRSMGQGKSVGSAPVFYLRCLYTFEVEISQAISSTMESSVAGRASL